MDVNEAPCFCRKPPNAATSANVQPLGEVQSLTSITLTSAPAEGTPARARGRETLPTPPSEPCRRRRCAFMEVARLKTVWWCLTLSPTLKGEVKRGTFFFFLQRLVTHHGGTFYRKVAHWCPEAVWRLLVPRLSLPSKSRPDSTLCSAGVCFRSRAGRAVSRAQGLAGSSLCLRALVSPCKYGQCLN